MLLVHSSLQFPAMKAFCFACRWAGVEHVYVNDHQSDPSPSTKQQLKDFEDDGFVTYTPMSFDSKAQLRVYYTCMRAHYHKHNWLAFFDIDEFLILRHR
jgi:hypothetical protein